MTLVELIVALTVLAVLSSTLYGAIAFGGKVRSGVGRQSAQIDAITASQVFLRTQLAKAVLPANQPPAEPDSPAFVGSASNLGFTAPWLTHIGQGRLFHFELSLRSGKLTVGWRPVGVDGAAIEPGSELVGSRQLLTGVSALNISYFRVSGNDTGGAWQSAWRDSGQLPDLVRISIDFADHRRWPDFVVVLAA